MARLTKARIKKEIIKCGKDPIYFINNYVYIAPPTLGRMLFKTYEYQDLLIKDFLNNRFNILLKARQIGASEIVRAYCLWMILFQRDKEILVLSIKQSVSNKFVKKTKKMYDLLPQWLKIAKDEVNNRTTLELSNGSLMWAGSNAVDAGRSDALSLLVIDEAAILEGADDIWTSAWPAISTGGSCVALSTPYGVGNWFHKTYTDAEDQINNFNPIKLMWSVREDRGEKWLEKETKGWDKRKVAQEFLCLMGDTKIVTQDGFKFIKDIELGDKVLTHKGRFRKVLKKFEREENKENIDKISTPLFRREPVYITNNHPIYSLHKKKGTGSVHKYLENGNYTINWFSTSELKEKFGKYKVPQYLNGVYPQVRKDNFEDTVKQVDLAKYEDICYEKKPDVVRFYRQKGWTKRFIEIDYFFGKFVGLFLAKGCYCDEKKIQLSFNSEESSLVDFITDFCDQRNFNYSVERREYAKRTVVYIQNNFLVRVLKDFIAGRLCSEKILKPIIFQTNENFIRGIVDGIWLGNGPDHPEKKNIMSLANEKLVYQVRFLMSSFGLITRLSDKTFSNPNVQNQHCLELNGVDGKIINECTLNGIEEERGGRCKKVENTWWGRIRIEENDLEEEKVKVFNIEVEEDNSYVCSNLIVHNCDFLASGETVISPDDLKRIEEKEIQPPKHRTGFDRNYHIWKEFEPGKNYLLTADVARGDGADFSSFIVLELENMEQVAEYKGKPEPDLFAEILYSAGMEYGGCLLVVENNSYGFSVLTKLIEFEYQNLYFCIKSTHEHIDAIRAIGRSDVIPGFSTTVKTRPMIIAKLEEFIRNRVLVLRSKRLLSEMRTFIWKNGKPEALKGYNDDLVMPLAIACWVRDIAIIKNTKDIEYKKAMIDAMLVSNTKINTCIPGMNGYNKKTDFSETKDDRIEKEFLWLYKG